MKRKTKTSIGVIFNTLLVLIFVAAIAISVQTYWIGYHNMDSSWNMRQMELWFNVSILDLTSTGEYVTVDEGITMGNSQMRHSFYLAMLASFGLGLVIGGTVITTRRGER